MIFVAIVGVLYLIGSRTGNNKPKRRSPTRPAPRTTGTRTTRPRTHTATTTTPRRRQPRRRSHGPAHRRPRRSRMPASRRRRTSADPGGDIRRRAAIPGRTRAGAAGDARQRRRGVEDQRPPLPAGGSARSIGLMVTPTHERARAGDRAELHVNDAAVYRRRAAVRAGILVTGTEVLTGIIRDRNGPWLSERLRDLGVDAAMIEIVGDRPEDLEAALQPHGATEGLAVIVTSGGLGPTADDLTAEIVGHFCGREMVLDAALEERIAEILRPLHARAGRISIEQAIRAANRKQARDPGGRRPCSIRSGPRPGLVVPAGRPGGGPTVVGAPRPAARATADVGDGDRDRRLQRGDRRRDRPTAARSCGCSGSPRRRSPTRCATADAAGIELAELEITTCLRRGEIEVATRFEPPAAARLRRAPSRSSPSATATPCSRATARRSTSRSRGCWPGTRSRSRSRVQAACWPPG